MRTRRDANHAEIVAALKAAHIDVIDLADVPANVRYLAGLPDLIAGGYHQVLEVPYTILIEIKTESGKLRQDQADLQRWYRGALAVVRTPGEALALFGIAVSASKAANRRSGPQVKPGGKW